MKHAAREKPLSIGEVAKRTGLRASALRYYEDKGILPRVERVGNRRVYRRDALRHVDVLRFALQAGFSLKQIKRLIQDVGAPEPFDRRWQSLARAKLTELAQLERRIGEMKRALEVGLACGCIKVEDCTLSPELLEQPRPLPSCCGPR